MNILKNCTEIAFACSCAPHAIEVRMDISDSHMGYKDLLPDLIYILNFEGNFMIFPNIVNTDVLDILGFNKFRRLRVHTTGALIIANVTYNDAELYIPRGTSTLILNNSDGITSIYGYAKHMIMRNSHIMGNIKIHACRTDMLDIRGSKHITSCTGRCDTMRFDGSGIPYID